MKIFKKLMCGVLLSALILPSVSINAEKNEANTTVKYTQKQLDEEAENLYIKIKEFLKNNKDVSSEKIDDVCEEYIKSDCPKIKTLKKEEFEKQSKDGTVLYYATFDRNHFDDLKKGIVKMGKNVNSLRGTGLYSSTSPDETRMYVADRNGSSTTTKILLPKEDIKILENEHLEKLKEIICNKHGSELGSFSPYIVNRYQYIYDSMSEYLVAQIKKGINEIKSKNIRFNNLEEQKKFWNDFGKKIGKDPVCINLKANRKVYFKTNEAAVFYNSGLLTKFLGYDVLHSKDSYTDFSRTNAEEYLIVSPEKVTFLS